MAEDGQRMDLVHIGPGTIAGRYFRRFWHPILRAEELAPGEAKPARLLGEDFTLFRGHSGKPYLVGFRCAHRGTQLSTGWVEEDCIRCLYHGWKFDGGGQCVAQPAEEAGFAAKVRIAGYPTREALGLIFVYVGEGQPPEFPYLPFEGEGIVETEAEPFPCDYLSNVENTTDYYHINWVHRRSAITSFHVGTGMATIPKLPPAQASETEFGLLLERQFGSYTSWSTLLMPDGLITSPGIPGLAPILNQGVGAGLRPTYLFKVPVDDFNHLLYSTQLVRLKHEELAAYREKYQRFLAQVAQVPTPLEAARRILAGTMTFEDVADHPKLIVIEDLVTQIGQGRIVDREHEHLGQSDSELILLRRILERELRALAEGRPLKQWQPLRKWPAREEAAGA